jgi:hypothetical protein
MSNVAISNCSLSRTILNPLETTITLNSVLLFITRNNFVISNDSNTQIIFLLGTAKTKNKAVHSV